MNTISKILILASNPRKDLNLDSEIRQLREVIDKSQDREKFQMADELAVQIDDLQRLILKHEPNIVHFCGHGSGEQGLIFQDDDGYPQLVSTEAISGLFKLGSNHINCVVLNACYSEVQAKAIGLHIDYVIGMQQAIQDESAIAFAKGFYQALAHGRPIEESYNWGCNAIQFLLKNNSESRKLEPVDIAQVDIPEHQKPVLLFKGEVKTSTPSSDTALLDQTTSQIGDKIANKVLRRRKQITPIEPEPSPCHTEKIPDFINRILENYFSNSALKWSLCFTGEDESTKLGELTANLRNKFSGTGNGKQIPSGFSYWGIIPTIAWETACRDRLYQVMRNSIQTFKGRWKKIPDEHIIDEKYNYVSLGVGTGEKDQEILARLYANNHTMRYFPVDMSSAMLRSGSQVATEGIELKGSNVLPIQIDFSIKSNISELRNLLDQTDADEPILFSLLGNTLANFEDDRKLLADLSDLMKEGDKLLLEVATTECLNKDAAEAAQREYSDASSLNKFVTSALFQYTNLNVERSGSVEYEGSIEEDKALLVKILYRNTTGETVQIMLPDREYVEFEPEDTIRLLTTRKYTLDGIEKVIASVNAMSSESNSRLELAYELNSPSQGLGSDYGFGIALLLLHKRSAR
jgi:L-histidine Nalpha-methyltransferase